MDVIPPSFAIDRNAHPGFCISVPPHYTSPGYSSLAIIGKTVYVFKTATHHAKHGDVSLLI